MTSQTFFLIFIPILSIILLAVYFKYTSQVGSFFKVNAYKFYMSAACFFTVSLPMKILLTSLGVEILIPVWAGLYACLLIIAAACSNGKTLPKLLMFVTAFSIAAIVGYIFILILPQLLSSIKQLAIILSSLGLFSYCGFGGIVVDIDTSTNSMNSSEVNKSNPAGEGPSNSSRKRKAKSPLRSEPDYEGDSSGSDYDNAIRKLKDSGVKFLSDGKIAMGDKDLSDDSNLLKIRKYSSPFDLTSQASNNIPIQNNDTLLKVKNEMAALQKKIHGEVKELVKQHYRIGKSVRHSLEVPVLGGHVVEASSFDSAIKVNSQLTQERLNSIFVLAERKHQLAKAIQFSPFFRAYSNAGILSSNDLKILTDVSASLAIHNDNYK